MNFTASTKTQYETHSFWNGLYKNIIQNEQLLGPGCGILPFSHISSGSCDFVRSAPRSPLCPAGKSFLLQIEIQLTPLLSVPGASGSSPHMGNPSIHVLPGIAPAGRTSVKMYCHACEDRLGTVRVFPKPSRIPCESCVSLLLGSTSLR